MFNNNRHKTENIPIKTADVDINIIPVVTWLNSFNDVFTLYSCESAQPYVSFICTNDRSLRRITETLRDFAWKSEPIYATDGRVVIKTWPTLEINFNERNIVRYTIYFYEDHLLDNFKAFLKS